METKKNNKKHIFSKVFTFSISIISIAIMLTMADLFSSLITVGGFSFVNENIYLNEYNIYAVCTSSYQTKVMATEFSETIKSQGGAGFVYMNKDSYYIVASMYENEADAKKVLEKNIEEKPNATVIKICIPPITISSNLQSQEKTAVNACLSVFKNCYKKLYDISVSIDTAVTNEVNARLDVNQLLSDVQTSLNNFNILFASNITSDLLNIKLGVEDVVKVLKSLIESTSTLPFTALIKEAYCNVICCYKNMSEQM